ncbi:MAG: OmpA family protein [Ignavibacteria bacterium]|nr:OmpA family protein [Ignavibacteria bacterium]
MRQILLFSLLVICFIFCTAPALAQLYPAYGAFGNYNLNMYQADFRSIPTVPSCCPLYEDGSGSGYSAGLLYEIPLAEQFRLALRAGYSTRNGTMKRTETTTVAGNLPGVFEHQVDATLADIGIEPLFGYNPLGSLWVNIGGRLAYVSTNTFSQKETLISPTTGVFSNGATVRNEFIDQPIPESSALYAALMGGVSYDVPLNSHNTLLIAPEILFSFGVTPVVSGLKWNSHSLRFGLALKYSPQHSPTPRFEKIQKIDTIRRDAPVPAISVVPGKERITLFTQELGDEILTTETLQRTDTMFVPLPVKKKDILTASVAATGVNAKGDEIPTVKIEVEEFSSTQMTTLLNYIFFDESSSAIPKRYRQLNENETVQFREDKINDPNPLSTYYQILNILGKRMLRYPGATVTLVGCNADIGAEKGNLGLSKQRAEAVKVYLTKRWNVPASSIKIETRNLPEKAALSQREEGYQENRRVEISSSNPAIIAQKITNDTVRKANPPSVRFRSQVMSTHPPATWSLTAEQNGTILKRFEGTGNVPGTLDWNMDQDGTHPRTEQGITYTLSVTDTAKTSVSESNTIAVELNTIQRKKLERVSDKEIERYSLILFKIRSTEINAINKPIIDVIKKNIDKNTTIKITGYSDRLGDEHANELLAIGRAKAAAAALGIPENKASIIGKGNADTYDSSLPEGRLYTRTVDVMLEKPIMK